MFDVLMVCFCSASNDIVSSTSPSKEASEVDANDWEMVMEESNSTF